MKSQYDANLRVLLPTLPYHLQFFVPTHAGPKHRIVPEMRMQKT